MKRNTKLVGNISELAVMKALIGLGYDIAVPWGDNTRYDLLADKDSVISRVQVKTGRLKRGAIEFKCFSVHAHGGNAVRFYRGEVDYFGVFCPQVNVVLLVPISEARGGSVNLRWEPTKNGQHEKIRWAKDYLISSQPLPTLGTFVVDSVPYVDKPANVPS